MPFSTTAATILSVLTLAAPLVSGASIAAGKTYSISPASYPDLCVVPANENEGARLKVTNCDSSNDIAWTFDGKALKNSASDKCADVVDGANWSGNQVQIWGCYSWNRNQMFATPSGLIQWAGTNMCLDLTDGRGVDGTTLQLWSCFEGNTNQQWTFEEVTEVDDDDEEECTTTETIPSSTQAAVPSATSSEDCEDDVSTTAAPTASLGNEYWTGGNQTTSASASASATASSDDWDTPSASASDSWNATSTSASIIATATPSTGSGSSGNTDMSGYLQVSGTRVVDPSGNDVVWRGTNLGGWLVWEDWMCGITDNSGSHDRFPQTTLENRFGEDQTRELMKVWQDNWLVSSDFDLAADMGFNVLRLPFSHRNFVRTDGSYIYDSNGKLEALSRLEWAVAEAKKRNIYLIPTYHIWEGQEQGYSTVSEDTWEGQQQRNRMGELWGMIASNFVGESIIAAYDAINEPTGSANNNLQRDLYKAIRKADPKRIIIMESISAAPDADWTNVMYSMHEYLMMGETDIGYNQQMYWNGLAKDTNHYTSLGVPTYIGEFMAGGDTLDWMLDQMNNFFNGQAVSWSSWTLKTVQMDRWGLWNFSNNMRVDVSSDSFDSIKSQWSNMGSVSKSRVVDSYTRAAKGSSWKRDEAQVEVRAPSIASPRVAATKRSTPHGGRSRRMAHGRAPSF